MSNINKFLKGGKKKGDAPVEPVVPKPGAVPPLVEGKTRQVDLSGVAQADAARASEEEVTTEVSGKGRAPAPAAPAASDEETTSEVAGKVPLLYPAAPPKPVPPTAASGKVVPISSARAAPAAPVAADADEAEEESPAPSAPVRKPAEKEKAFDPAKLLEQIKTTVKGLLAPFEERLGQFEEALKGNDDMVNGVIETIQGPNPDDPDAKKVDDKGKPVVGLAGQVAALSGALDELRTQLLGPNPQETLGSFGGNPVVPLILEQVMETATQVKEVVGKDGERIPSIVMSNTKLTAKTLVIEMLKEAPDEAKLRQAAKEGGPDTAKDILATLASKEDYAVEVVGALYLAPAESLDDADKVQLKAEVVSYAKAVGQRAAYYHDNLDWAAIEQEAAAWRAPESEPEETGGDA